MPKHTPFGLLVEPPFLDAPCNVYKRIACISVVFKILARDYVLVHDIVDIILVVDHAAPKAVESGRRM